MTSLRILGVAALSIVSSAAFAHNASYSYSGTPGVAVAADSVLVSSVSAQTNPVGANVKGTPVASTFAGTRPLELSAAVVLADDQGSPVSAANSSIGRGGAN